MHWIFLSPHYDDAIFSCGGLIWELRQRGEDVEIWTVCSGLPADLNLTPFARELHARWGVDGTQVIATRQEEDRLACQRLGAAARYLGLPDCIYRRLPDGAPVVQKEDDLWLPVQPGECGLVEQVAQMFRSWVSGKVRVVSPFTVGKHVDHRLTRMAAEAWAAELPAVSLAYYADFPYVLEDSRGLPAPGGEWVYKTFPISSQGMAAWEEAITCYKSQLSTFWSDLAQVKKQVEQALDASGGYFLLERESR